MAKFLVCILLLVVAFDFIVSAARGRLPKRRVNAKKFPISVLGPTRPVNRARPSGKQQYLLQPVKTLPAVSDGLLHLYALPVGQGNSLVLQCPDGDIAIIDLGSVSSEKHGFWSTGEIKAFLQGHNNRIKNIVITHNDTDHYSFFKKVFPASKDLEFLENIYISCTFDAMPDNHIIRNWIIDIGAKEKIREFSKGYRCGHSKNELCKSITLCPQQSEIIADVLSANAGGCGNKPKKNPNKTPRKIINQQIMKKQKRNTQKATKQKTNTQKTIKHKTIQKQTKKPKTNQQKTIQQKEVKEKSNIDSIVIGIKYNTFIMHLNGDFEDHSKNQNENGPQKTMVDVYGDELKSTVYMLSHHGANSCANKEVLLDAVQPKAVFSSSDPFRQNYRHPKCSITDYLKGKNYLCKPMDSSCGRHPMEDTILDYKLQQIFTCGEDPDGQRTVINNDYAIYSTTPSKDKMNLVHLMTDGDKWGFINGTQPRIRR